MKPFHIIVLAAFIFLAVVGVVVFATYRAKSGQGIGAVTMWGTLPQALMESVLQSVRETHADFNNVSYVEKDPRTYESDMVNAIAAGTGPDIFLLPQDRILSFGNKIMPIPFSVVSERVFRHTYLDAAGIYLSAAGIAGIPYTIDPMVMYWNRDLFATAGVALPPNTWDQFFALSKIITKKNPAGTVTRATVPLGEYANIPHAKDILATLILQVGNPIVRVSQGEFQETFDMNNVPGITPQAPETALRFYTEFSNPTKDTYTWNRGLPNAREMFTAGDVAMYFGFSSELPAIRNANPNLNFDVARLPQALDAKTSITFGRMTALSIPRGARNPNGAFQVASVLSGDAALAALSLQSSLPPVSRALLSQNPPQAYQSVFFSSALIARAWFDPSPEETDIIFKNMIEDTTSGKARLSEAVQSAARDMANLLR